MAGMGVPAQVFLKIDGNECCVPGTGLLFRDPEAPLPSPLGCLTSEFGMGSGVTTPLKAPGIQHSCCRNYQQSTSNENTGSKFVVDCQ